MMARKKTRTFLRRVNALSLHPTRRSGLLENVEGTTMNIALALFKTERNCMFFIVITLSILRIILKNSTGRRQFICSSREFRQRHKKTFAEHRCVKLAFFFEVSEILF